jgi:eukaryotic-like serine/threonine-protein kinase
MVVDEGKQGSPGWLTDLLREVARPDAGAARPLPQFVGTNRFQVLERLGAGGCGVVYLVQDLNAGAQIALKTLAVARPELIYRLKREFRALADLRHDNLVSFYELFAEDDRVFFTMEYVPGSTFHEYVRRGGRVDELRLRSALAQLVRGLSALHQAHTLHRDVKPSNVLVTPAGRVVLLDFGLATQIEESGLGRTADLAGTPEFMSPEHAAGAQLSPASDWYSVGVLLYQALTGRLPFQGSRAELASAQGRTPPPSPAAIVSGLPRDLCDLCEELLAQDPVRRPGAADIASIVGSVGVRGDLPDEARTPSSPFIGREHELGLLRSALEHVKTGRGVTGLVEGTSGIGKTTLVQRFLARVEESDGATVLRGRCYERERVSYQGIDSLIDDLCRLLRSLDASAVAGVLPRHLGALVRLFPVFERIPAIAEACARSLNESPDAQELRRLAFGAMRELLARIADRRLLVLHVDDLQWGDVDTTALLREVLRAPDAPAMLLVLSFRAEERERSPCLQALTASQLGEVVRVEVGPLDGAAAETLARELLASDRDHTDAERIAAEAGGNPFFIQELVRFASHASADGRMASSTDLIAALRARIEQLPAAARQLVDVVAVAGHPVAEPLVRHAAGFQGPAWDAWHLLDQVHLVRFGGSREARVIEPYHDRIRETVLAALPPARAVACHIGLARVLEETGDADPEVLARHHEAGGNVTRAGELAATAANQADEALAFDRAARLFRWALQLTHGGVEERSSLLASLGRALANAGRGIEAAQAYREAAELVLADARRELHRRAAEQLLLSGRIDEGRELVSEDLRGEGFGIPRTARRALASLLVRRAVLRVRGLSFTARPESEISPRDLALLDHLWTVNHFVGLVDVVRGGDFGARMLLAALRSGERLRIFLAMAYCAGHAGAEAPLSERTMSLIRRVEDIAGQLGTPAARAWVRFVESIRSYCATSFASGLVAGDEADRIFRERCTGMVWESWSSRLFANCCRFYLGAWNELGRRVVEHLEEARDRGNVYAMTVTRTPFGFIPSLARGDTDGARAIVREAVAGWSVQGFHLQHYWFLHAMCLLDLHAGDATTAHARLRDAWGPLAGSLALRLPLVRMQMVHLRGSCALATALVDQRSSERRALLKEAGRAARTLERMILPLAGPFATLLRAGAAAVEGQTESAAHRLEAAATDLERQQVAPYAAAARWQLARLRGDVAPPFLPGEDVVNPAAMARTLAPGFAER